MKCYVALVLVALASACSHGVLPGAARAHIDKDAWQNWRDLTPLVATARTHADKATVGLLEQASKRLREGKPAAADTLLARGPGDADWIAIARADLAALHFVVCIRGVAWRLEDGSATAPTDRERDFSSETKLLPTDISVEATLSKLDAPLASNIDIIATHARIARARVAAFASRCAPNEDVAELAAQTLESDLSVLAARGHLTPDLAYLWASVQLTRFSSSAARPFLEQARAEGFTHPAVTTMLGVIALDEGRYAEARGFAQEALMAYQSMNDAPHMAEATFLLAQVTMAETPKDLDAIGKQLDAALKHALHVPALLARIKLEAHQANEAAAIKMVHAWLPRLLEGSPRDDVELLEALVMSTQEPHLVQLFRDALVDGVDLEDNAMHRGLRYFFAATLDARLGDYALARGHAGFAKDALSRSETPSPIDVDAFLRRIDGG